MENTDIRSKKRKRKHHNATSALQEVEVEAEPTETPKKTKIQYHEKGQPIIEEATGTREKKGEEIPNGDDNYSHVLDLKEKGNTSNRLGEEEGSEDEAQNEDELGLQDTVTVDLGIPSVSTLSLPSSLPAPQKFSDLNLSQKTLQAISSMQLETMTEIQQRAIPPSMSGKDILGAAKTGSGKTLAFLIPAVEMLSALRFKVR